MHFYEKWKRDFHITVVFGFIVAFVSDSNTWAISVQ